MPVELGLWRLDSGNAQLSPRTMPSEDRLEELIVSDPDVLGDQLLVLDRQVKTEAGNRIDVLGMDDDGDLYIVELKRDRTPRDVIAQALDYASWVRRLSRDDVRSIFEDAHPGEHLEAAFEETFGITLPEEINENHNMIIVAAELDPSTERIVSYLLEEFGVPINAVFFRYYEDGDRQYLARSWLVDPFDAEASTESAGQRGKRKEPWNGTDFYFSFEEGPQRRWSDALKYNFVSAGQGRWYTRTMDQLFPGARIFVYAPQKGYIGVARVVEEAVPVTEFDVEVDGQRLPILKADVEAPGMDANADDPEKCEYLVRVDWIDTRDPEDAVREKGMFANQNTVCKLRNQFTLDRLTGEFDVESA